ncbi:MAG: hypothetical protein ABH875_04510, partial [Candidatus Omnitrophota bacterium]
MVLKTGGQTTLKRWSRLSGMGGQGYPEWVVKVGRNTHAEQKKIAAMILKCLFVYYEHDCNLAKAQETHAGFFYKQLQKPYYEAGIESNIRIVLRREGQR